VQVDVEPDTVPGGDGKDAVELTLGVAIDLQRVDAADQIGTRCAPPRRAGRGRRGSA
jgi:hypothetical protein